MPNYIHDTTGSRWMVSNPARNTRTGMNGKVFRCPFCAGSEGDTPPEVYRVGEGEKDKIGWSIRVFANLFPITEPHEVIVHSPDHNKNIEDFPIAQVEDLIKTYINRYNALKEKGKIFIFHNYGLISGASLPHPHSQISVVPEEIPTRTLPIQPVVNIVEQVGEFVSYCPEYSEWSYEVWITQIKNEELRMKNFEELDENQIKNLAKILQSTISKLKEIHNENPHYSKKPFGYNYYFGFNYSLSPWYLRIIPRFMERAGFELSTGIMVNSVSASQAASELRNIKHGT
jgi:UDPglucose--hexose-1-phosphate uridylyltransferase